MQPSELTALQVKPLTLVIDANMMMSLLMAEGSKRKLFFSGHIKPVSPEFVLFEIGKYWQEIIDKSKLSEEKLRLLFSEVRKVLNTLSLSDVKDFMSEALNVSPDPDDAEYFALALKLNCPIWSEDKLLKKQLRVKVLNTPELMTELGLRGYFTGHHLSALLFGLLLQPRRRLHLRNSHLSLL